MVSCPMASWRDTSAACEVPVELGRRRLDVAAPRAARPVCGGSRPARRCCRAPGPGGPDRAGARRCRRRPRQAAARSRSARRARGGSAGAPRSAPPGPRSVRASVGVGVDALPVRRPAAGWLAARPAAYPRRLQRRPGAAEVANVSGDSSFTATPLFGTRTATPSDDQDRERLPDRAPTDAHRLGERDLAQRRAGLAAARRRSPAGSRRPPGRRSTSARAAGRRTWSSHPSGQVVALSSCSRTS